MLNSLAGQGLAAGLSLAIAMLCQGIGHAAATDDGQPPPPPPVVCAGSECSVTAVAPGGAASDAGVKPDRPENPSTGNPVPNSAGAISELAYAQQLLDSGLSLQNIADRQGRAPILDPVTGEPMGWLGSRDSDEGADVGGGIAPPSPAQLAQVAVSRLLLPVPMVGTSPSGDQVLGVPTWLWVDRASWGSVSATAAVPGVSVTATAVPVSAVWSMGNGDAVRCAGPGTPYGPASDPASGSPDCGYTYARSSAGQPAERFAVTVTVTWRVSWSGGGQSGVVDGMSTQATTGLRVREVQAVVVAS